MKIVYLVPETGFTTELRSDTLWGIVCWGIRNIYGQGALEEFIGTCKSGNPAFIISSAFPFIEENGAKSYFLPKPMMPSWSAPDSTNRLSPKEVISKSTRDKKNKKKAFLRLSEYEKLVCGEASMEELIEASEPPRITSYSFTHNTIDRIKNGTLQKDSTGQLFHVDERFIQPGNEHGNSCGGLFFLADGPDTGMLEGAIRWLSHVGIGGDRHIGKGKFRITMEEFRIRQAEDFNAVTNLSLYYPSRENRELEHFKGNSLFNYLIEERQGYYGFMKYKQYIKPAVRMFKEGSVFPSIQGPDLYGSLRKIPARNLDQGFDHDVYQYGIGFMVKMKIRNEP